MTFYEVGNEIYFLLNLLCLEYVIYINNSTLKIFRIRILRLTYCSKTCRNQNLHITINLKTYRKQVLQIYCKSKTCRNQNLQITINLKNCRNKVLQIYCILWIRIISSENMERKYLEIFSFHI